MIPELEELVDTGFVTNTTALAIIKNLSNNFSRRKNDSSKDRKALEIYVSLRGYKQHDNQWTCQMARPQNLHWTKLLKNLICPSVIFATCGRKFPQLVGGNKLQLV